MRSLKVLLISILINALCLSSSNAATSTFDLIRLRPVTVPASCSTGQILQSTSDNKIKFCSGGVFLDLSVLSTIITANQLTTADVAAGTSHALIISTGAGTAANANSGNVDVYSGLPDGSGNSGYVSSSSATVSPGAGNSGDAYLFTGNANAGTAGSVFIYGGDASAGTPGDVFIYPGQKTGPAYGKIYFQHANEGTSGNVWTSTDTNGGGHWATLSAAGALTNPTLTQLISTGTQTGWLFTISTSSTVAVGDTYTNNSNTYTVQGALTATSGQVLYMSGTGATSGTTLTRSAGSGTSSITFSTKLATATYTTPSPAPLYIKVTVVGGGGGGGGSGTPGASAGTVGKDSFFGANLLSALRGGAGNNGSTGAAGDPAGVGIPGAGVLLLFNSGGGSGSPGQAIVATTAGGIGGSSYLAGGGRGGTVGGGGGNAQTNSGAGGGGASSGSGSGGGGGGAAGGTMSGIITGANLISSFPYIVGTGGTFGAAGSSGFTGGTGADGIIIVEEYYQ